METARIGACALVAFTAICSGIDQAEALVGDRQACTPADIGAMGSRCVDDDFPSSTPDEHLTANRGGIAPYAG